MRPSNYFNLSEFLVSSTARKKNIDNFPSWDVVEHLNELALYLDDLREAWGSGIRVTSGYRSPELNKAVGGVPSSMHQKGFAADLQPSNGKIAEFVEFARKWFSNREDFDQVLVEKKGKTLWVHLGLYNNAGEQRHIVRDMEVK